MSYSKTDLAEDKSQRVFVRPSTTMRHVWVCLIITIIFYCALGVTLILIPLATLYKVLIFVGAFIIFNETFLRYFGITLIKCYQHYATDEMRSTCLCVPSCSEYSIIVLKRYPLIISFILIVIRLNKTCDGTYKEDYPSLFKKKKKR